MKDYLFVGAFSVVLVLVAVFVFVSALALTLASTFVFASDATAGAVSVGVSPTVCKTETFPVKAGIEIISADSIKTVAAIIVSFDKIVVVPRG